jgi:hypothetical protein
MIFQLIYTSIPTAGLSQDRLDQDVQRSRARNETSGITGVLLMTDDIVLQIFEGEDEAAIRERYRTVRNQDCHRNCEILMAGYRKNRSFPQWAMGVCKPESDHSYQIKMIVAALKAHRNEQSRQRKIAS